MSLIGISVAKHKRRDEFLFSKNCFLMIRQQKSIFLRPFSELASIAKEEKSLNILRSFGFFSHKKKIFSFCAIFHRKSLKKFLSVTFALGKIAQFHFEFDLQNNRLMVNCCCAWELRGENFLASMNFPTEIEIFLHLKDTFWLIVGSTSALSNNIQESPDHNIETKNQ